MDIRSRVSDPSAKGDGIVFEEQMFCIGELSLVLDILRSKIYSDPLRTICQEIACNARDANREVGNANVSIDITLPTQHDTHLRIRDYGPGISPDRMKNVFISYGTTTKQDDYNQTGGLGLGCKSPWSYSDWFEIVVYQEEYDVMMKRLYRAYIDESRVGKIVLKEYHEVDDDSARGTEIIVPIKENDFLHCYESMLRVCSWWKYTGSPQPNIFGMLKSGQIEQLDYEDYSQDKYDFAFQEANWALFKNYNLYGTEQLITLTMEKGSAPSARFRQECILTAVVDGICYPIDTQALKLSNTEEFRKITALKNLPLMLFFDNDEVSPAANRESFDYDEETISIIKFRLFDIVQIIEEFFDREITQASNVWDAHVNLSQMKSDSNMLSVLVNSIFQPQFNGRFLKTKLKFDEKTIILVYNRDEHKIASTHAAYAIEPKSTAKNILCLDDCSKSKFSSSRMLRVFRDDSQQRNLAVVICKNLVNTKKIDRYANRDGDYNITLNEFTGCNPVILSTVVPFKKTRKRQNKTKSLSVEVSTYVVLNDSIVCRKSEIDLHQGYGYYVGKHYSDMYLNMTETEKHDMCSHSTIRYIVAYMLLTKKLDKPIICINQTQRKQLGNGWVSLAAFIQDEIKQIMSNDLNRFWYSECQAHNQGIANRCLKFSYAPNTKKLFYDEIRQIDPQHEIVAYFDHQEAIMKKNSWYKDVGAMLSTRTMSKFSITFTSILQTKLSKAVDSIFQKYPLVAITALNSNLHKHLVDIKQRLIDYIKLVDKG